MIFKLQVVVTLFFTLATNAYSTGVRGYCNAIMQRVVFNETVTADAFIQAFPDSVKFQGSVSERLSAFQALHPDNVAIVDGINFKLDQPSARSSKSKKALIISLKNLNENQQKKIVRDYLDYLSWNTIEFKGEGHLYSRFGDKVVDYYVGWNINNYRFGSQWSSVMMLEDAEMIKMKQYIQNVDQSRTNILGSGDYDGAKRTHQSIYNNTPLEGGHNCTSWMCTAPVGENGESLKQLAGGAGWDVGTSPRWWKSYLAAVADSRRNPYNLLVSTDKSLSELVNEFPPGSTVDIFN